MQANTSPQHPTQANDRQRRPMQAYNTQCRQTWLETRVLSESSPGTLVAAAGGPETCQVSNPRYISSFMYFIHTNYILLPPDPTTISFVVNLVVNTINIYILFCIQSLKKRTGK